MKEALLFGALASSALVFGGVLGAFWRASRATTGVLLAFASGTLFSALAFELYPIAVDRGGMIRATIGLLAGAATFVVFNTWLDRNVAPTSVGGAERAEQHEVIREASGRGVSLALLASVTLDGIPENLTMGVSLRTGPSFALLMAIFASNFPEALVGAMAMRDGGQSKRITIAIWSGAALLLALMVVLGEFLAEGFAPNGVAWLLSFAGGAVLASLADTLMPEAFERGRPWNSFATAAGFVASFALAHT